MMLFKMKRLHNLIHCFRLPKEDVLFPSELSEILILMLAITAERYQYKSLQNQHRFNCHALCWKGATDSRFSPSLSLFVLFYNPEWITNSSSTSRRKGKQKGRGGQPSAASGRSVAELPGPAWAATFGAAWSGMSCSRGTSLILAQRTPQPSVSV